MNNQQNLPYKILAISVIDYAISLVVFCVFLLSLIEIINYKAVGLGAGMVIISLLPALVITIISWLAADGIRKQLKRGKIMHIVLYLIIAVGLLYFALIVKNLYFNPLLYLVALYAIASSIVLIRVKDLFISRSEVSTNI